MWNDQFQKIPTYKCNYCQASSEIVNLTPDKLWACPSCKGWYLKRQAEHDVVFYRLMRKAFFPMTPSLKSEETP